MLYFDFLSLKNKEQSEVGLIEVKYKLNRNNIWLYSDLIMSKKYLNSKNRFYK